MCKEGFHKVGKTYEDENEEKMKEELDFGTHYEGRPGLGCRALVKESFSKIYPGIIGELADWNVSNRRQSASLLLRLLVRNDGRGGIALCTHCPVGPTATLVGSFACD